MEVTALCIQILISVFTLLSTTSAQSFSTQKPDFPVISPDQLQFFEYQSVSVSCPKNKYMMKNLQKLSPANEPDACSIPAPSCTIDPTFEKHSGEYWCENDEGERSQAFNISITDGPVILKFTAQPVKEGSDVILHCINKNDEKPQTCDFIKDGQTIETTYDKSSVLMLQDVSTSDEGFYRCSISGVGVSAESWLSVIKPEHEFDEEPQPVRYVTPVTILSCIFGFLLLLAGLIYFKKHKALKHETVTDLNTVIYAVVNKPRRRNGGETRTDQVTYASVAIRPTGRDVCAAPIGQYSSGQEPGYSFITK